MIELRHAINCILQEKAHRNEDLFLAIVNLLTSAARFQVCFWVKILLLDKCGALTSCSIEDCLHPRKESSKFPISLFQLLTIGFDSVVSLIFFYSQHFFFLYFPSKSTALKVSSSQQMIFHLKQGLENQAYCICSFNKLKSRVSSSKGILFIMVFHPGLILVTSF